MPYYPSSQVKTNLYTNGGEFVTKLGNVSYTGFYWKTSSGKYFSGKTPQDSNIIEIIIPPNSPGNDDPGPLVYGTSNTSIINSSLITNSYLSISYPKYSPELSRAQPLYTLPTVTDQNYQQGYFTRYFCKKTNEFAYLEIDKDTYDKLKKKDPKILHQLYKPFELKWQLTGNKEMVYKTNKNLVDTVMRDQKMYLLNKYLKENYTQFWKSN
jgi:hypothetical protein